MSETQIQKTEQPTMAFVLSLLAGLWMLSAGGMMGGFGGGGMMGGWHNMGRWQGMQGWMWGQGMHAFGLWWPRFGVLAGILVTISAVMLYTKPEQQRSWGVVILIVSALDFFLGMGGLLAGALGAVGGALALGAKA